MSLLKEIQKVIEDNNLEYFDEDYYLGRFSNVYEYHEYCVKQDKLLMDEEILNMNNLFVNKLEFYADIDIFEFSSFEFMISKIKEKDKNLYVLIKNKSESHLLRIKPEFSNSLLPSQIQNLKETFENNLPKKTKIYVH